MMNETHKLKILYVSNMYPSAEKPYAGIYVKNLYERMKASEVFGRMDILTMERRFTSKIGSIVKYMHFFLHSFTSLFRGYDVVHLHFLYPLILWVYLYRLLHPSARIVVTCHGSDINKHFYWRISRSVYGAMLNRVDTVVAVGSDLADAVKHKLGRDVEHVIPAGINEAIFYREAHQLRRYDLLYVGSFLALKGIPELVSALQGLGLRQRICFVGSGPLEDSIKQLEMTHDIKIMHNLRQEQLRSLYNQARYLLLPSHSEAFGLVVSESMFCGTPVIATRTGGIKDQLQEGLNGFYIEPKVTASTISDALEHALNIRGDSYESLTKRALMSNRQFALAAVCQQYLTIYSI